MRPLVDVIDGRWDFATQGTGTLITWRWTLRPKGLGTGVLRPIAWMWRGYARQALELLSEQLLARNSLLVETKRRGQLRSATTVLATALNRLFTSGIWSCPPLLGGVSICNGIG